MKGRKSSYLFESWTVIFVWKLQRLDFKDYLKKEEEEKPIHFRSFPKSLSCTWVVGIFYILILLCNYENTDPFVM